MKFLLPALVALFCALPATATTRILPFAGPCDVFVTSPMGETVQVFREPKSQKLQQQKAQELVHTYTSKGHTITLKTTRFDFNGHGAWETEAHWRDRHAKAIVEMETIFPPDKVPTLAIGSLPLPEYVCPGCPGGNSTTVFWWSEIPSAPGTYYGIWHHVHRATWWPVPETEVAYGERTRTMQGVADQAWPLP